VDPVIGKKMKKRHYTHEIPSLYGVSGLSLVISGVILCLYLANTPICKGDINNIIMTLGILISVLVGWQIYQFISTDKRIQAIVGERLDKERNERTEQINETQVELYMLHLGNVSDTGDWNAAVIISSIIFRILDTLTDVGEFYENVSGIVRRAYEIGNIREEHTVKLLASLEMNLENSEHVRELDRFVRSRRQNRPD
jgi:hypothetical protein